MLLTFLMLTAIFCTSGQSENRFEKPIRLTNFRLANKLHNAANPGEKNYLVSPYAIQLALSMLYLGTNLNSQTGKQIKAHGLDLGTNQLEGMKGFYMKSLIHSLTDDSPIIHDQDDEYESDPTVLRARLFLAINKQYNVDPNYAAAIRRFSNNASSVIRDDFGKYGQHVINTINERISNLTDNMIQNFLPPGSLNDDTVLSLINAIYLKAEWNQDAGLSRIWRKKAFRLEGGTSKYLLMFEGTVRAPYFEDEKFQLIKLPMKGDDYRQFWMYIVLPKVEDRRNFLSPIKTFVKSDQLGNITELRNETIRVTIPEIAFEYEDNLVDDLESLGIKDIFHSDHADFGRITNSNARGLFVKEFRQKVAIGVDSTGVKAAAAVAVSLMYRSTPPKHQKEFFADHPFLFYITVQRRDNNNLYEHVVFSGQFTGK